MNKVLQKNSSPNILLIIVFGIVFALSMAMSGCATTKTSEQPNSENKADPYENFNRKMFTFNSSVDEHVAKPISDSYKSVTPQIVQTGVANFFNNLKNINVIINDILQAKFSQSMHDTGRIAINTTLGVGGLIDVAKHAGLEQNDEDFDQTLAVWGVAPGSYLVLPFLGPSTTRGVHGSIFDAATSPTTYTMIGIPINMVSVVNTRSNADGSLKFINEAALDPYVFTRESFMQWRNNLATDGKAEASYNIDDLDIESLDNEKSSDPKEEPSIVKQQKEVNSVISIEPATK